MPALTCSALQDTAFTEDRSAKSQVLLSAKEAVSLWVLGARKVGYLYRTINSAHCTTPFFYLCILHPAFHSSRKELTKLFLCLFRRFMIKSSGNY